MIRFIFGIVVGIVLLTGGAWLWFHYGRTPVAVADESLPFERALAHLALQARIDREKQATPPVKPDETTFVAGARVYREQCAFCHGLAGHPSVAGTHMFPDATPLWEKHGDVIGVSDDPPGETYWKVTNGIRLTGMPAYKQVLSETETWQVSVLLANADKPLPPAALTMLKTPLAPDSGATSDLQVSKLFTAPTTAAKPAH